jgi:ATP-dependent helicase/nuclease subunit B
VAERLDGVKQKLLDDMATVDDDDPARDRLRQDLGDLAALRGFALPLLEELAALPARGTWGEWLDRLSALATRALRSADGVLAVLASLRPMGQVGPVDLREVRLVLGRSLTEIVSPARGRRYGAVLVAPIEAARGLSFDVVFVPGLAERLFPQKVVEDAILRDVDRAAASPDLETNDGRVAAERLALRLAVGTAAERLVLSYPRVDMEQGRPRVPSFYGLEILRAVEGRLPGFDELAGRAERMGGARIGWPAPADPEDAIDEAEHDLCLLDGLFKRPPAETIGMARYLLSANPHLARALRFRARRWMISWTSADGLVNRGRTTDRPIPAARLALGRHSLASRSFSPTALQTFAQCPYRFLLYTVHRFSRRQTPAQIEELDPLQRGSLVHEVQFELMRDLRDAGLLPVRPEALDDVRVRADAVLDRVAARYRDDLHPAIERVWDDGVAAVRADLREWLRRLSVDDGGWVPWRFELSFGLSDRAARDEASTEAPVPTDSGIRLRGSIDLVERSTAGVLRATDYKTGKARTRPGMIVGGGEHLQPVLYALALEKLFPEARVAGGRLYYCTSTGGYEEVSIPLDEAARQAAETLARTVSGALDDVFLPAAPRERACDYCDFQVVCGPYEVLRSGRKPQGDPGIVPLSRLRGLP